MGRYGDLDYPKLAKRGSLLGVALLLVGAAGKAFLPALVGPLPAWEHALLLDAEILGLLVGFLSPVVFGIVLPLTE